MKAIPRSLFRFRPFNSLTLDELCNEDVHYADPACFNDPLDSRPNLVLNSDFRTLVTLHAKIAERLEGKLFASDWRYLATRDAPTGSERWQADAADIMYGDISRALRLLFAEYRVLSLSSKWNSPLMWSHYADEHRGICIEYGTNQHDCWSLKQVRYDQPRSIKSSDLTEWLVAGSQTAEEQIREAYFFRKAREWTYEREWRDLASKGVVGGAPFRMKAIYFGIRCSLAIKTTIVRLFGDRGERLRFYAVTEHGAEFRLQRTLIDADEIDEYQPQPSDRLMVRDTFAKIDTPTEGSATD
jgi:hypothetical protein